MSGFDKQIEQARKQVMQVRRIVERQRLRVASGIGGPKADMVLASFEKSQKTFERNLQRLLDQKNLD